MEAVNFSVGGVMGNNENKNGSVDADSLRVVETDNSLTREEMRALKQMAQNYISGKRIGVFMIALGALAVGLTNAADFIHKLLGGK